MSWLKELHENKAHGLVGLCVHLHLGLAMQLDMSVLIYGCHIMLAIQN
jgi:hypothetical protein